MSSDSLERGEDQLSILASVVDRSPQDLGRSLAALFRVPLIDLPDRLNLFGPELAQLALANPSGFEALIAPHEGLESEPLETSTERTILEDSSPQLRAQLSGESDGSE